jgi:hypothetical protein
MKLSTFARLATKFYLAGSCKYLRSAPGRGKTTTIEDAIPRIGQELGLNIGIVVVSGPNLTPGDTMGFGIPKHTKGKDGRDIDEMVFTLPFFFKTSEGKFLWEYDGGVIFIDEADKAELDVKKVLGEMALSGRCGPHFLPKGWIVWMAGNRAQDRSGSTKELDHLINRRFEINIEDDIEGWATWAIRNDVHPSFIAFARNNPHIVFPDKTPEVQGPFCTPRSLVMVARELAILAGNSGELPTDTDAVEIAAAGIGEAAAGQLFATLRLEADLPDIKDIIAHPMKAKMPEKPDSQMLVCYKLASLTDATNVAPVIQYIERMPADFASTFCKAVVTRNARLAASKPMMDWCKRNTQLMAVVSQLT